ncbi:hypothetical protein [Streptomyces sp. NPDC001530]
MTGASAAPAAAKCSFAAANVVLGETAATVPARAALRGETLGE